MKETELLTVLRPLKGNLSLKHKMAVLKSHVYTRVLTRIHLQCERPPTRIVARINPTHIHWWIGTRFATGSELKPG